MARSCGVVLLVLAAMGCGSCGQGATEARRAPLAELVTLAADYDGRLVVTEGVVRSYTQPRHYWIEDDQYHRVALRPHPAVSVLVGERVEVVGRFSYQPDEGRSIRVEQIRRKTGDRPRFSKPPA